MTRTVRKELQRQTFDATTGKYGFETVAQVFNTADAKSYDSVPGFYRVVEITERVIDVWQSV